jgi:hypothetical protein
MTTPITPIHDPWCGYWFKSQRGVGPKPGPPEPPVPVPIPTPPPNPDTCMGCWGPQQTMRYCPSGSDINVSPGIICGLDPIVSASIYSGDGSVSLSGSIAVFNPGTGGPVIIQFDTRSGNHCYAWLMPNPPGDCCGDETLIGYTSLSMMVNETQQFTVIGGIDTALYTFEIIAGGGTITSSGLYTAPSSNPGCINNATVGLFCYGVMKDSIELTINAYPSCAVAEREFVCQIAGQCGGTCWYRTYDCNGIMIIPYPCAPGYLGTCSDCHDDPNPYCYRVTGGAPGIYTESAEYYLCPMPTGDVRTTDMIKAGCCPPVF